MKLLPKTEYSGIYDIPFEHYFSKGVRGVIFDIDNTLVLHDAPADENCMKLFRKLHEIGFRTCIVSNNKLERVKSFADAVDSDFVEDAGKPGVIGYEKALEKMKLDKNQVISIGDQLLTDIWGSNNAGIYSVLVSPIGPEKYFHIKLKRIIEKPFLYHYHRKEKRNER